VARPSVSAADGADTADSVPSDPPPRVLIPTAAIGPAVVCAAALVVPLAYLPILTSVFAEPKLALLSVAGAACLGHALIQWARGGVASGSSRLPRLSRALVVAVAAWLATTLLSAVAARVRGGGAPGAPYAGTEIARLLAVVGIALGAAQAASAPVWRRRLLTSTQIAGGLVSLIGLLQHLQILPLPLPVISVPGSTFGNRNIAAEAIAMSIPFGLAALALASPGRAGEPSGGVRREGPGPILFLLALQIVYLGATRTRGAWLGALAAVVVFYLLRRRVVPRAAVVGGLAFAVAALAAATIPGRVIPRDLADAKRFDSGEHVVREALDPASPVVRARLGLWRRTLSMYASSPLLGVGPGNFVIFFPLYAEPGALADGVLTPSVVPRRAHQDLLERLAETGPLGLAAWLAVTLIAGAIALRRARAAAAAPSNTAVATWRADAATLAAGAAGSLAALFACGLTGFPLAMPATALLLGVALGFLGCEDAPAAAAVIVEDQPQLEPDRRRYAATRPRVVVAGLVAAGLLTFAVVAAGRNLARLYGLARARVALRAPDLPGHGPRAALAALERAERIDPGHFDVALETGFVLIHLRRYADARAAVDRALVVEPHAPNAWCLRAEAGVGAGDLRRGAEDARHATALLADYPEALVTLAHVDDLRPPVTAAPSISSTPSPRRAAPVDEGRAGARLDRLDSRRREGARVAEPDLSRRRSVHAALRRRRGAHVA
jgi:O-antigen ligase